MLFKRADVLPHADDISAPELRRQASEQTARILASTYASMHAIISRPGSGYSAPESILPHTPRDVEALLGLM